MALVRDPPARSPRPRWVTIKAGTPLYRVWKLSSHTPCGTFFRTWGPTSRFDHQRAHPQTGEKCIDPERGVIYLSEKFSCCVVEFFDDGTIKTKGNYRTEIVLHHDLRLLDIRGRAAMCAGVITAISQIEEYRKTQAWAREFYENCVYEEADGLLYLGAHNAEDSIVLFERAESAFEGAHTQTLPLDAPSLREELLEIAADHNLDFV